METYSGQQRSNALLPVLLVGICSVVIGVVWCLSLSRDAPFQHVGRVLGVILPVDVGLLLTWSWRMRKGWTLRQRIVALAVCASVSLAAWWFIPTRGGTNLWSAESVSRSLNQQYQSLPSEAVGKAQALKEEAKEIAAQFPHLTYRWEASEQAWCERAGDQMIGELNATTTGDFANYEARSSDRSRLKQLSVEVGQSVKRAEASWLRETAESTISGAEQLAESNPQAAVILLRTMSNQLVKVESPGSILEIVLTARTKTMESVMDDVRKQAIALVESESYDDAMRVVDGLDEQIDDEAKKTGLSDELTQLKNGYRYLNKLQRVPSTPEK